MSDDQSKKRPYKVGYSKPPIEHQILKGQTLNKLGRPVKPARSLTLRQAMVDVLRIAEKPVKVRRDGKTVEMSLIEAAWESVAAKAASGHAISQRFLIKHHQLALEQLERSYPKFLGTIERFEDSFATANPADRTPKDESELNHLRRRTWQLVQGYDERRDPYVIAGKREGDAYLARQRERDAMGIRRAEIYVDEASRIVVIDPESDPTNLTWIYIGQDSFLKLTRIFGIARRYADAESLHAGVAMECYSYSDAIEFLQLNEVPFVPGEGEPGRNVRASL